MLWTGVGIDREWKLLLILVVAAAVGLTVGMKLFRWEKEEKIRPSAKLWVAAVILPFLIWGIIQYKQGKGQDVPGFDQQKSGHASIVNPPKAHPSTTLGPSSFAA